MLDIATFLLTLFSRILGYSNHAGWQDKESLFAVCSIYKSRIVSLFFFVFCVFFSSVFVPGSWVLLCHAFLAISSKGVSLGFYCSVYVFVFHTVSLFSLEILSDFFFQATFSVLVRPKIVYCFCVIKVLHKRNSWPVSPDGVGCT